jgi:hypothetical protein
MTRIILAFEYDRLENNRHVPRTLDKAGFES